MEKQKDLLVLGNKNDFYKYLSMAVIWFSETNQIKISTIGLLSMAEEIINTLVLCKLCDEPSTKDRNRVIIGVYPNGEKKIATQITLRKRAVNKVN